MRIDDVSPGRARAGQLFLVIAGALVVLTGCPKGGDNADAGPPPDACNSKDEAVSNTACQLVVNAPAIESYISEVGDQDWYSIKLPGTVTAKTLLQVTAGYGGALGTPVDFNATLLKSDGNTAMATGVDHPSGAPHYVTLVVTLDSSYANQTIYLLVGDALNQKRDARTPYHVQVTVVDNPDPNEPNDTPANATPITLSGTTGTTFGYLATPNDVDQFTFTVPNGRKIAYVHVTAPTLTPPAPPTLALSYQLYNQSNVKISEGRALPLLPVDLATARLSNPTGGTYRLVVTGFPTVPNQAIPGDVRFRYDVTVMVLDDQDANEGSGGDDAQSTAKGISSGSPVTGRISYVGDADWYVINGGGGGVLHYKITPSGAAGRFPPLPGPVDRLVRVFTNAVNGASVCQDEVTNVDCPKDLSNPEKATVEAFCATLPQNLCMHSQRKEDLQFPNLRNLEGVIPVAAGTNYYIVVEDEGTNWADDSNYTLTAAISPLSDPAGTTTVTMPDNGSYTAANPSPAATLTGEISYGHAHLGNHVPTNGDGVRAPHDYDGQVSDEDVFQLNFASTSPGASGWLDRAWPVSWTVDKVSGQFPGDLMLSVEFCDGSGGGCVPVTKSKSGNPFNLFYTPGNFASWHLRDAGTPNLPAYEQNTGVDPVLTNAAASGCFCIEPRLLLGGTMKVTVSSIDRNTYDPITYSVKTALAPYPQSYQNSTGATVSCPTPKSDGGAGFFPGCLFTTQ